MRKIIGSCVAAALLISAGVASAQSVSFSSEFGVGAQGSNVTNLQTWLTDKGYYSGPITGYYGSLTQGGVEAFQTANGISATGFVGPLTLAALNSMQTGVSTTGTSSNSTELAQLQSELNSLLAQIQAIESGTTNVPTGTNITLQTNEGVGASGAVTSSGTGPFTYAIVNSPSHGTVTSFNTQTGAFVYTPNANFSGTDTFTYTVANSSGTSAPMTVTIAVSPTSNNTTTTAPSGQATSFSTSGGVAFNGTLVGNGTGPFTYAIVTGPTWGTISNFNSSTGAFTYTPTNATYTGSDSFTYTVSNGTSTSLPTMVSITD